MQYICTNCESKFLGWSGKCPSCGAWGTLEEDLTIEAPRAGSKGTKAGQAVKEGKAYQIGDIGDKKVADKNRVSSGYDEFDRVLGGGFVAGEVVLLSGEPGIGKSTLLLQVAMKLSEQGQVLYVTGEESLVQVKSRYERIVFGSEGGAGVGTKNKRGNPHKLLNENLLFAEEYDLESILDLIDKTSPIFVVVDSIQSVTTYDSKGFPGSMSQVRLCGSRLIRKAKELGVPMVIVGQITKEGTIAGPKILEHSVDCVIYIEGDEFNAFRVVRGMKNRFGATNEIGVFEMRSGGMAEVLNPSQAFLESSISVPGCAVGAVIKGTRVVFVEVQALVIERESEGGPIRRVANGIKKPRLDMLCAVLSRHGGVYLGDKDVFVNIVGGLSVDDPIVDLAVCAAIKSSIKNVVNDQLSLYVGEVGLTGEVRNFVGIDQVVKEAQRLGYKKVFAPSTVSVTAKSKLFVSPTKGVSVV